MLCAHWEGFLKKAVRLYVEYIFSQNLRIEELSPRLLAIALFEDVLHAAEAKYPGSEGNHLRLAEKVLAVVNGGLSVSGWNVETEGNPGTDVLEKILKTIGIDHNLAMDAATWAATKIFINDHIVWDRHKVAHGEGYRIEKGSLLARIERLLSLLDILASNLLNAAEQKAYLRR
jgi:hypothetical protein